MVVDTVVSVETCDRCGVRAANRSEHPDITEALYLCEHHTDEHLQQLTRKGWTTFMLSTGQIIFRD